jgi:ABC-type glycerol-3-phosphate transport system substrate-binding protein
MRKALGVIAGALLVLAACGGGGGGGSEKASPTTTASTKPPEPGQLDVTFGEPVPYTPTEQLEGVFNENQNPVAVDVMVTNHGHEQHPGLGF